MSNFIPKANGVKVGGLSRKAQKLQSLLEKQADQKSGGQGLKGTVASAPAAKANMVGAKKVSFQRKAV